MSGGVLVVGEALIDEVVHDGTSARHVGGSPANVALGLARLGVPTRLHTAIGPDDDGGLVRRHLDDSGVELTPESDTDSPTSRAIATLGADGSASYEFALAWEPRPLAVLGSPAVIHTGSLGALLAPGHEVARDIVRRGRAAGSLITFDPNVRPALLPDSERTRQLVTALVRASHLVKLSDEDAAHLYPGAPTDAVLDLLLETGASVAGITLGADGARLASGDVRVTVPSVVTRVADTVGAGDSFMAALIGALVAEGWDGAPVDAAALARVGALAATAASITVSRPGADLPTLAELEEAAHG